MSLNLAWLPELPSWRELLEAARQQSPDEAFSSFQRLANSRMDFVRAMQLDRAVQSYCSQYTAPSSFSSVRLGLLGSGTLTHLLPGIRLGALRRRLLATVYVAPYGMYRQELAYAASNLHRFRPEVTCFSFDAQHLASKGADPALLMEDLEYCWRTAESLGSTVLQQTALPRFPLLMGNNEYRMEASEATIISRLNEHLQKQANRNNIHLLDIAAWAGVHGLSSWFDPALWYSAKQEVHPRAAVFYGDLLGRLLGALRGKSAKCVVLDLDNTLWGGVIGDDGLEGIILGQGSPAGEAFVAFQRYLRQLAQRGILLAVCSKNDFSNAVAPFEGHPEMVLRREDISCFVANWQDKATNLRNIAATLNISLDSLVFVDDNPAERRLIRSELPSVAVPELPEEPAAYVDCLAEAGYFEATELTAEDSKRTAYYRTNVERQALREAATDMDSYLAGLNMELLWDSFSGGGGLKRITQLINKTNQFNLTTRRLTEVEVAAVAQDSQALTLQLRLTDVHGDNGMISVIIGHREDDLLCIDTWLMSCRVLGRGVEEATLNLLCEQAKEMSCRALFGVYQPSPKNEMVREHYQRLGFDLLHTFEDGGTQWIFPLKRFAPLSTHIRVLHGGACKTSLSMTA